ncbi:MAG: hypothetical protein HKO71_04065, partial [Pseudomonadales bacterium]|nr:hypothetical protein [Pseudomonadales bacterium]
MLQAPGDDSFWYVVEQGGTIKRFSNSDSVLSADDYLSIAVTAGGERGLLGLAFAPDWPSRKELYVSYTINDTSLKSRLSRLLIEDDSMLPVTYTEQVIIEVDQPFDNHNGGDISFGIDSMLYFGLGDGGSGGDPLDQSQNTTTLLGSMLRIDVDGVGYPQPGYAIPATNRFSASPKCGPAANPHDCPEIYAWGLRNPWRWSFDSLTNELWLADVGQNLWEEVNTVVLGGNYGWRCREATHDFNTQGCPASGLIDPVYEYPHDAQGNLSVTGGYVYRGSALPGLMGNYIFGDYVSGRIWALSGSPSAGYSASELIDSSLLISSFAQDTEGELFITSYISGEILQLVANAQTVEPGSIADNILDTGCLSSTAPVAPAPGLIPYAPNARFWSDGASKQRWLALPNDTFIDASIDTLWQYPPGTVAMKNFELDNKLVETRLFMQHQNGEWAG